VADPGKRKAGPNIRTGFLEWVNTLQGIQNSAYLLLQGAGVVQHCLWQHAPRVREAAARATTAAILVMVMEYFASFLSRLLYRKT
jgi:hypothetical protein